MSHPLFPGRPGRPTQPSPTPAEGAAPARAEPATPEADDAPAGADDGLRPRPVRGFKDVGVDVNTLLTLALKIMYVHGVETAALVSPELKLPSTVTRQLLEMAKDRGLLDPLGIAEGHIAGELRYGLTGKGRKWVEDAFARSKYLGAAPVPLAAFTAQVRRQALRRIPVERPAIEACLAGLHFPGDLVATLGPALNSGRAILIYGPPGTGKTALATALAGLYADHPVYIPHAIEVEGQIIKMFDPSLHQSDAEPARDSARPAGGALRATYGDERWLRCKRPLALSGGELTLEMLEMNYDAASNFYEAPLQMKAAGGVFVIDDFGRQMTRAADILDRWIGPLEQGRDFAKLRSGKKFDFPFDGLVLFVTNLRPDELLDQAMRRRVPYRVALASPSRDEFKVIFDAACAAAGLEPFGADLDRFVDAFYVAGGVPFAGSHPRAIIDHVLASCRYRGVAPGLDYELVIEAASALCSG